jgi:hypothetical protein
MLTHFANGGNVIRNGLGGQYMNKFWAYLCGTVIKPRNAFTHLLADPRQLVYGGKAVLLIGVLYTLTVIGLAIARVPVAVQPWIAIPAENYYFWEIFFGMPVFVMGWILAAGLVQLLSKCFKGSGTFEGTFAVLGFVMTVPMFVMWIVETLLTVFILIGVMSHTQWGEMTAHPGFWQIFGIGYQLVALAWYLVLAPIAVAVTQKLHWWQAAIVGTLTVVIVGFVMVIFIR